jgi:peptide/nickel transport system permease protein
MVDQPEMPKPAEAGRPLTAPAAAPAGQRRPPVRRHWLVTQFLALAMDGPGLVGLIVLAFFFLVAAVGVQLAPHDPTEIQYLADGSSARVQPPSAQFWFGTTTHGRDVFSQTLSGARVAVVVGFLSAVATVFIGTNIGLFAGYYGGWLDTVLMRLVDISYGIPFLPFAIILVSLLGPSVWNIILVITLLFWRTTARVIRAQVLSLKERPYVWSARAAGASHLYILYRHILPNVLPLVLLYTALSVGGSVLTEAGLSFLGFGDPNYPSWGTMLNQAFRAGAARTAWWWILPPGLSLSLFVVATYLVGRSYEVVVDPRLRRPVL